MSIKPLILASFVLSSQFSFANSQQSLDSEPVSWLLEQIRIGEAQLKDQLIIDSLERLKQVQPNNPDGLAALARFQFEKNLRADALSTIFKLSTEYPNHPSLQLLESLKLVTGTGKSDLQQARLLARAGQYTESLKVYDSLFPHGLPTPQLKFEYVKVLSQDDKNWLKALKALESLKKEYPNTPEFEVAYASHILDKQPNDKKALAILKKFSNYPSVEREVERSWLNALDSMELNSQTLKKYDEFVFRFPANEIGKSQRESFLIKLRQLQKLQRDPYYRAWISGKEYMAQENYTLAKNLFIKALSGRPKDAEVLGSFGLLHLKMGQHDTAIEYFKKADINALTPEDQLVWQQLANTSQFWQYIARVKLAIEGKDFSSAQKQLELADKLNESKVTVLIYTAKLHFAKGSVNDAQKIYQKIISEDELNSEALNGLLDIIVLNQSLDNLTSFTRSLSKSQYQLIEQRVIDETSTLLRNKADDLSYRGELAEAIDTLEKAILLSPDEPWLHYDLAKIYLKMGNIPQAKTIFKKALWRFPMSGDVRYAHAIFLNSLGDYKEAVDTLNHIPRNQITEKITELKKELIFRNQINQLAESNSFDLIADELYALTKQPNITPGMRSDIAVIYYKNNQISDALSQLSLAIEQDPDVAPYWNLLKLEWLLDDNQLDSAAVLVNKLKNINLSTTDDQLKFQELKTRYLLATTPNDKQMEKLLDSLSLEPSNKSLIAAIIEKSLETGELQVARQYIQASDDLSFSVKIKLANQLLLNDYHTEGEQLINSLINEAKLDDGYQLIQLMESLVDFKDRNLAIQQVTKITSIDPSNSELLNVAGRVAQSHNRPTLAINYFQQAILKSKNTPPVSVQTQEQNIASTNNTNNNEAWYVNSARSNLKNLKEKFNGHVAVALDFSGQTSTQTESTIGLGTVLTEAYFPLFNGKGFVKLDPLQISAPITDFTSQYNASIYGTGLLCYPTCSLISIKPQDRALGVGLGWQNENWRFDIGTTPIGFLIEDTVWGVYYQDSFSNFGWDIEIEKRPITSTVLSYSGLEDVNDGKIWGGVRSTGVTVGLYHDLGLDWGFWATADYQQYKGVNVLNNNRYRLMSGAYNRIIQNTDLEFSVGINLMHWSYKHNLIEQTFGHGGYYSPQNYLGASIPLTLDGRYEDFVYRIKAGIGYSSTETETIAFYPNDPLLQQKAIEMSTENGVSPYFLGSKTNGVSYNFSGSLEYKLTPHWLLGGSFNIDRADFYEPNFGQIYVKYVFNSIYGPLPFPPDNIIPYASF